MPSPTTALKILEGSAKLINCLMPGETLDANDTGDLLEKFNDLLEAWSIDNLNIYGSAPTVFNLVGGQTTPYTYGAGGTFNGQRPERIGGAYVTYLGVDYSLESKTQDEYSGISLKTQTGFIPEIFTYVSAFPLGLFYIWPIPLQAMTINLLDDRILTQIADVNAVLSLPQGYTRSFKYCLAVEIAPVFGKQASADVKEIAVSSRAAIKRLNSENSVMTFDGVLRSDVVSWQKGY